MTRKLLRSALAASAVALVPLGLPAGASAANPPACDPSVYPVPFLVIDGSTFAGNTRWFEMRQSKHSTDNDKAQSDPEHPFSLTVDPSNSGARNYTVNDYAKDQFPEAFSKGETVFVTATYVEVHTEQDVLIPTNVRCTRTVTATFKAPPQKKRRRGRHHRHDDGQGQQGQQQGQDR